MKSPKACCGKAPLIFTGKNVFDKTVFLVECMVCGHDAVHRDKDSAVHEFNKGVKREAMA